MTKKVRELLFALASAYEAADAAAVASLPKNGQSSRDAYALGRLSEYVPERAALIAEALGEEALARELRELGAQSYDAVRARWVGIIEERERERRRASRDGAP